MSLFIDIVSLAGSAATIAGVSLRDFQRKQLPPEDRQQVELFLRFLESREVLFAGMDDEVQTAVIRSLEEIKREAEAMRQRCNDEHVQTVLLKFSLDYEQAVAKAAWNRRFNRTGKVQHLFGASERSLRTGAGFGDAMRRFWHRTKQSAHEGFRPQLRCSAAVMSHMAVHTDALRHPLAVYAS